MPAVTNRMFPESIRPYVRSLADLMYYANLQQGRWAYDRPTEADPIGGVYGHAKNTITAIVREIHGDAIAATWTDHFDLGADATAFHDVCQAIEKAQLAHEEEYRRANPAG